MATKPEAVSPLCDFDGCKYIVIVEDSVCDHIQDFPFDDLDKAFDCFRFFNKQYPRDIVTLTTDNQVSVPREDLGEQTFDAELFV